MDLSDMLQGTWLEGGEHGTHTASQPSRLLPKGVSYCPHMYYSEDYQKTLCERSMLKSAPGRCLINTTPYYSVLIILYNCRLSLVYECLVTYYIHKMNVEQHYLDKAC